MPEAPENRLRPLLARIAVFVVLFCVLQFSWQLLRGSAVEYAVIHYGTVRPAAALIALLSPELLPLAVNFSVRAAGGGINVLNGCEGLDALFLLLAAFGAADLRVRSKSLGLLLGIPLVFAINQARIVTLFYAHRWDASLFDLLHSAVAPILIVLAVTLYFHGWLVRGKYVPAGGEAAATH